MVNNFKVKQRVNTFLSSILGYLHAGLLINSYNNQVLFSYHFFTNDAVAT